MHSAPDPPLTLTPRCGLGKAKTLRHVRSRDKRGSHAQSQVDSERTGSGRPSKGLKHYVENTFHLRWDCFENLRDQRWVEEPKYAPSRATAISATRRVEEG